MFNHWCLSQKVRSFDQLKELVLLEEFKNCVPISVATYLNEQRVSSLASAAVLADEYILTHRGSHLNRNSTEHDKNNWSRNKWRSPGSDAAFSVSSPLSPPSRCDPSSSSISKKPEVICFFCRKPGHKINECSLYKKGKSAKSIGLINIVPVCPPVSTKPPCSGVQFSPGECTSSEYSPFLATGLVSLTSSDGSVPVCVFRDTGAAQSFILHGILPLSPQTATGQNILVRGFEMGFVEVPLHRIHLKCDLVTGDVVVGVRRSLPVPGVTFILGNYLAGGNVWTPSDVRPFPIVGPVHVGSSGLDECDQKFPAVFPACAVTRAMKKRSGLNDKEPETGRTSIFDDQGVLDHKVPVFD